MLFINSNNPHYTEVFKNLFQQKKISISNNISDKFFAEIFLDIHNDSKLTIETKGLKKLFNLPVEFENIFNFIVEYISNLKMEYNKIDYFPYKQELIFKEKKFHLKEIHNIIFANLILNKQTGIDKSILYKKIWPQDKVFSINKLETHLTNLKNDLRDNLKFNFQFSSNEGILSLRID